MSGLDLSQWGSVTVTPTAPGHRPLAIETRPTPHAGPKAPTH